MYGSTRFGRPHAHRQELNNCSSSLWFYRWNVVIAVLFVVFGPVGRPVGLLIGWFIYWKGVNCLGVKQKKNSSHMC